MINSINIILISLAELVVVWAAVVAVYIHDLDLAVAVAVADCIPQPIFSLPL
jgi:hypothetical protein